MPLQLPGKILCWESNDRKLPNANHVAWNPVQYWLKSPSKGHLALLEPKTSLNKKVCLVQTWNWTKSGKIFRHPWKVFSRYIQHSLWIGAPAEGISFPFSSTWSLLGFAFTTFGRLSVELCELGEFIGQPNWWLRNKWPAILLVRLSFIVFIKLFGWFWLKLIFFVSQVGLPLIKRRDEIWLIVS